MAAAVISDAIWKWTREDIVKFESAMFQWSLCVFVVGVLMIFTTVALCNIAMCLCPRFHFVCCDRIIGIASDEDEKKLEKSPKIHEDKTKDEKKN
jgi:hypothetical protein